MAPPIPTDHDLNKIESTLPENASPQVSAFLAQFFLVEDF